MIRFSTRSEYGLRMMMDLARAYGTGPQPLTVVAWHEALPATYLEQLVGKLRRADLVVSRQGVHGGYELSRPPADISVGDIMRVLEGPISPMVCATEGETELLCERQIFCSANIVWERCLIVFRGTQLIDGLGTSRTGAQGLEEVRTAYTGGKEAPDPKKMVTRTIPPIFAAS